jgi:uncharacterized protein YidB (DUF937 family)
MSLMDDILKNGGGLGAVAGVVAKNPQILAAAASLLSTKDATVGGTSGLSGLVSAFESKGLGDVVSSWISTGANKPISASQLTTALGSKTVSQFATKAGIGAGEASSTLAALLPAMVNQLTPKGQVPETSAIESVLSGLLSGR